MSAPLMVAETLAESEEVRFPELSDEAKANLQRYRNPKFTEQLTKGFHEAKKLALTAG